MSNEELQAAQIELLRIERELIEAVLEAQAGDES
jgi:hypothetical protein